MAINRRKFLRFSSLSVLGAGLANKAEAISIPSSGPETPRVMEYRELGKTGFRVSDISSGTPSNEAVLKALLDAGVNFIDTGEIYGNGNNERLIGNVIRDYDRKKIFINSKLYPDKGFSSKEDCIERTRKALERLGTDYVDCMMIHSAENSKIIKDEYFHGAMEVMKQEGRVRHVGVSCHGNNWLVNPEESLDKILMTAVDDGRFDVFLLGYNFFNADIAEPILEACAQKGIGTAIMKANPVKLYLMLEERINTQKEAGQEPNQNTLGFYEKYKGMTEKAREIFGRYGMVSDEELAGAATRFVLSNPHAHTMCWAFSNFTDVKEMLSHSGKKLDTKDTSLLKDYRDSFGKLTCRIGCNACEAACPHHIPVGTIMRYQYYYGVKGQQKYAMEQYAGLPGARPDVCADCVEAPCEQACPYDVATRALLASAETHLGYFA